MLNILSVMLPIFLLIGLGLAAVRGGLANSGQIDGLSGFVLNFALPAVILNAMTHQDLRQSFDIGYIAAYACGSLVAFGILFAILSLAAGRPLSRAAMGALGGAASNTGFIGFPVATLAFGAPAATALPMTMMVETVLMLPLALSLAEIGTNSGQSLGRMLGDTALRLARMPLMIAIALGVVLSSAGLHLPGPVSTALEMLARASAPCALFVVGGIIAGLRRTDVTGDVFWIVAAKLLLHPLAVAAFLLLIPGIPRELVAIGILFSSVSVITIYPILCRRFGLDNVGATVLLAATGIGFVTISADAAGGHRISPRRALRRP